jgi:hypothetical protein
VLTLPLLWTNVDLMRGEEQAELCAYSSEPLPVSTVHTTLNGLASTKVSLPTPVWTVSSIYKLGFEDVQQLALSCVFSSLKSPTRKAQNMVTSPRLPIT